MAKEKYQNGINMLKFKRIEEISFYNHNFYIGFEKDLLFGLSDDDNETKWSIVTPFGSTLLGYSYDSEEDLLEKSDKERT